MARQAERRDRTRALLIEAAASCFETSGYSGTSLENVLNAAGVSKGALYHHFSSKAELLEAVFEHVSQYALARAATASAASDSPREALSCALKTWLRIVLEPRPRRILLEIGPSILGFDKARRIELAQSEAGMRALIERAVARDQAACADVGLAARLLNAAVTELALTALDRGCDSAQLAMFDEAIDTLIAALLPVRAADDLILGS